MSAQPQEHANVVAEARYAAPGGWLTVVAVLIRRLSAEALTNIFGELVRLRNEPPTCLAPERLLEILAS